MPSVTKSLKDRVTEQASELPGSDIPKQEPTLGVDTGEFVTHDDLEGMSSAIDLLTDKLTELEDSLQKMRMSQGGDALPESYVKDVTHSQVFLTFLSAALSNCLNTYTLGRLAKGDALCLRQIEDSFEFAEEGMRVWSARCGEQATAKVE